MATRPDDSEFTEVPLTPAEPASVSPDTLETPEGDAAPAAEEGAEPEKPEGEEVEKPEGEGEESEEKGEKEPLRDDKGKFKSPAQARIDELTRKLRDAERRAARAEAGTPDPKTGQDTSPVDASTEPKAEDFDNYGDYIKALTRFEVRQGQLKDAGGDISATRGELWAAKVEATTETLPDFHEVVGSSEVNIAPHVLAALMEADNGPALAYHMAQHPEVADRLNGLSPAKAAIEVGRLETSLAAPVVKAQTKAPAPISPARPGSATKVDLSKADMDTYVSERRKQGARY